MFCAIVAAVVWYLVFRIIKFSSSSSRLQQQSSSDCSVLPATPTLYRHPLPWGLGSRVISIFTNSFTAEFTSCTDAEPIRNLRTNSTPRKASSSLAPALSSSCSRACSTKRHAKRCCAAHGRQCSAALTWPRKFLRRSGVDTASWTRECRLAIVELTGLRLTKCDDLRIERLHDQGPSSSYSSSFRGIYLVETTFCLC